MKEEIDTWMAGSVDGQMSLQHARYMTKTDPAPIYQCPQNRLVPNDVVSVNELKHASIKWTEQLRTTDSDTYVYTTYRPIYLDCRLDCAGFDPCRGEIFLSSPKFSDLLWHTRSTFSRGEGEEEAAEDPPYIMEVRNEWSCTSAPITRQRSVGRDGFTFYTNTTPPSARVS